MTQRLVLGGDINQREELRTIRTEQLRHIVQQLQHLRIGLGEGFNHGLPEGQGIVKQVDMCRLLRIRTVGDYGKETMEQIFRVASHSLQISDSNVVFSEQLKDVSLIQVP